MTNTLSMRNVTRFALAGLMSALLAGAGRASEPIKELPSPKGAQAASSGSLVPSPTSEFSASTIRRGDRIKVAFFEMLDIPSAPPVPGDKQSNAQPALQTFYQRMDLSGELLVEPNGRLSFPRLGSIQVADRTTDDVKQELANAFHRAMSRKADVNVTIVQRTPVFINGAVRNPGAYAYVPGMVVMHALALAGGTPQASSSSIEQARETERVLKSAAQLKRLLARRSLIEAEIDATPSQVPVRLVSLAGQKQATQLIETERRSLRLATEARKFEIAALTAHADGAKKEFNALQRRSGDFENQVAARSQRMENLQKLQRAGYSSQDRTTLASGEFADFVGRSTDFQLTLIRAQQRQDDLERRVIEAQLAQRRALEKELTDVENGISDAEQVVAASAISGVAGSDGCVRETAGDATYQIMRRGSTGLAKLTMIETGELEPGDIVIVAENGQRPCRKDDPNVRDHASASHSDTLPNSKERFIRRASRR